MLQGGRRTSLQEVLRALERVSKTVTVLLSPEEVAFVANPSAVDSLQVWAVLSADNEGVFKTYRILAFVSYYNTIYCTVLVRKTNSGSETLALEYSSLLQATTL